jgi:hypothetical protein
MATPNPTSPFRAELLTAICIDPQGAVGGITLSNSLDLKLIEEDQEHVQFLIKQGVTKGTVRRFIHDIYEWVNHVRIDPSPEGSI